MYKYLIFILILMASCTSLSNESKTISAGDIKEMDAKKLLQITKESSEKAILAKKNEEKKNWALHGISVAEQCLMRSPEEAGCYYYRAVNTGLYYEIHIIGYQKGVKQMIEDCEKVIKFDPDYDHGGAYRILGQLYTQLPQTVGRADSIARDLDKAENFLKKAVRISPDYPENKITLADTLYQKENFSEASEYLSDAKDLSPKWKSDKSYSDWQITINQLEKKLITQ